MTARMLTAFVVVFIGFYFRCSESEVKSSDWAKEEMLQPLDVTLDAAEKEVTKSLLFSTKQKQPFELLVFE